MDASLRTTSLLLASALLGSGCTAVLTPDGRMPMVPGALATDQATGASPTAPSLTAATAAVPAAAVPSPRPASATAGQKAAAQDPMDQLLAELQAIDDLDSDMLSQLVADLRNVEPSLRPAMVRQYRALIAFRRRLAERDAQKAATRQSTKPPAAATATRKTSPAPSQNARATPSVLRSATDTTPASTSAVVPAVLATPASDKTEQLDWQLNLDAAITALEQQTREAPRTVDEIGRHARLRMLYLIDGRRDDALRPIPGILPAQQDFWSEQLFALATYLGNDRPPDSGQRASEAKRHLINAVDKLGELGTLTVHNLSLCTDVWGYGSYKKFETLEFAPGQKVLVYAEIDNYRSVSTEKGYHTSLRVSYEILDSRGQRVELIQPPNIEDYCADRRRDFHIRHFVTMPKRIYDGAYTMQLTIEDTQAQKIGQSSIEFTIKEGTRS